MKLNRAAAAAMRFLAEEGWTLQQFAETFEGGKGFEDVDPMVFEDLNGIRSSVLRVPQASRLRDEASGSLGTYMDDCGILESIHLGEEGTHRRRKRSATLI